MKQEFFQDSFLNKLRKNRITVKVYLMNGKNFRGKIRSFDQYAVLLSGDVFQLIYKHAIASIVPLQRLDDNNNDAADEQD